VVDDPDAEALEAVRAGDPRAFDGLVHRHGSDVRRLVRRYVGNDEDAKDVAQIAFARAFERLASFRGESKFRTWLFRIAINVALNHTRGEGAVDASASLDDVTAFTNSLGTSRLVAAEVWRKVQGRLEELPAMQRLVVELRVFHDLSFREIAAVADCSEDAAKQSFHRGVKSLRTILPR
jgi:RNA polymerase sigma-70 factor (ECF subfamily)